MPGKQGINAISETQLFPLGRRLSLDDGRTFHYCSDSGTGLAAGKLVGPDIGITERDDAINAAAAVAIGAKSFEFTAVGTITEDLFKEGFACIVNDTGEGLQYKIESNTAATAGNDCTITLFDPIITALVATTDVVLMKSMFSNVKLNPDVIRFTLGVPVVPVTASYYFWCQTWGPAMVLCGDSTGNLATERDCHPAAATGEFLTTNGGVPGTQVIGSVLTDSTDMVDTEYHQIYLTCIP